MPEHKSPTNAELRLLDELWQQADQTVRQVATALYQDPTSVQYRTVQVQLDRLEKKGLVIRDRSVQPHRFRATVDRGHFLGDELQSMADKVCEGSLAPLLLNLAGRVRLTDEQRQELLDLLGDDEDDGAEDRP